MDETATEKELKNAEYEGFKNNAELKAIIAGSLAKRMTIELAGIPIAVRVAIPKPLRDRLIGIAKAYQNEDSEAGDEVMYESMAQLCLEPPYNNPAVWRYIDDETGEVPNALKVMVEKITGSEVDAKRFRGK